MYPSAVSVSGNVPSRLLGVYLRNTSQQHNSRPVYQLTPSGPFLYHDDGEWAVGPAVGGIKTMDPEGLLAPADESDPDLDVTRVAVSTAGEKIGYCHEQEPPSLLGSYYCQAVFWKERQRWH